MGTLIRLPLVKRIDDEQARAIIAEIDVFVCDSIDALDDQFCENIEQYSYLIADADDDELIADFVRNCDDGHAILKAALYHGTTKEQFCQALKANADVDAEQSFYVRSNEFYSHTVGEWEHQIGLPAELIEKIALLSPDQRKLIAGLGHDGQSVSAYGRPCERIAWRVNVESLLTDVYLTWDDVEQHVEDMGA